jgi:hypothetical protein
MMVRVIIVLTFLILPNQPKQKRSPPQKMCHRIEGTKSGICCSAVWLPSFVGSAWADPRKVKDGLESSKAKSCWMDYENAAFLARQGLFHGVDAAMRQSEMVIVCMSNEYMGKTKASLFVCRTSCTFFIRACLPPSRDQPFSLNLAFHLTLGRPLNRCQRITYLPACIPLGTGSWLATIHAASETCRNELQHAVKCLRKPVLLLVVGSAESVERAARWEQSAYAKLVQGLPYVGNWRPLNRR